MRGNSESSVPEAKEMTENRILPEALSKIYSSIYYIDMVTGKFTKLSTVDNLVDSHIGETGDAQDRLNHFSRKMILPEYTDEILAFTNLSTLDKRMGKRLIISKNYQSSLYPDRDGDNPVIWRQCSFIEGDRDASGRLAHVLFVTQSINEVKAGELAEQKKLYETNENLTTLLAEEKEYTAIIGAMSSVYFGLYYIDLEKNTFQELFSRDKIHHTLGEKGNAREALNQLANELVKDAYLPAMLQFTDYDTLDERIGKKSIIVQEYAAKTGGWTQCTFIPVERAKNGRNRSVMCTLRWITAEKEVESQENLIQALAIPYDNIYTVNPDSREAIC
ncbi:MAG: hypothetical protein Q4C14_06170 [Bacillota bacterium]|nr:hypothetical protein [Bacillota bacterium]